MGKKKKQEPTPSPIQPDLTKLRDDETVPIAREVIKIIANTENLALGQYVSDEKRVQCYEPIYHEIMRLFVDRDVKLKNISYAFQLVQQALQFTSDMMAESVKMHDKQASGILFGKDADDITINDIERVLK